MFFNPSRSIAGARCAALFALLLAARGGDAFAQPAILTDLHGFGPRQLKSQAFVLEASQDVQIEAVGAQASSKSAKLSALATMWQHDGKEAPAWRRKRHDVRLEALRGKAQARHGSGLLPKSVLGRPPVGPLRAVGVPLAAAEPPQRPQKPQKQRRSRQPHAR